MFLSADVGGFWFDEFDDGGNGFLWILGINFYQLCSSPREICHTFWNLFLSVQLSLSHIVLKVLKKLGNGLAAADWFLPLSVEALDFE